MRSVWMVCALVLLGGCMKHAPMTNGAVISLDRRNLSVAEDEVSYIEYPSAFGLIPDEHARLMAFVNGLVDAQPHDTQTVFRGRMVYGDARYFSYALDVFTEDGAVWHHATYDRKRGCVLRFSDLVPESGHGVVRKALRAYAELLMPTEFYGDVKDDNFLVNAYGAVWHFSKDDSGIGSACEMSVGWDEIASVLKPDVRPTGRYAEGERYPTGLEWWRFPFVRLDSVPSSPPSDLFSGTNYPDASIQCEVEDPVQGGLSTSEFASLQSFLGTAICSHGSQPIRSVREGVDAELHGFWERYLKECCEEDTPGHYAVFEMEAKLAYRGPEYVSYRVMHQDGCPCCAMETNVVWSWSARRGLTSADLFAPAAQPRVRQLMNEAARRKYATAYEEGSEPSLPDYAKDWPHTLENFLLDDRGVTWTFGADEVIIGGKGPTTITLSWDELVSCLQPGFKRPSKL